MSHWSENSRRLHVSTVQAQDRGCVADACAGTDVALIVLPASSPGCQVQDVGDLLAGVAAQLDEGSTLVVLAEVPDLVHAHSVMGQELKYQLWISIQSALTCNHGRSRLPSHHFGALVYTKTQRSLIHCKMRLAYTFCPACGKTTKDYGGKKHTYHEYGTLISDVWRDTECDLEGDLTPVIDRFSDLLGIPEYHTLRVIDCRRLPVVKRQFTVADCIQDTSHELPDNNRDVLLQGDCLEILRRLPPNSIDLAFADPPYNLGKQYVGYSDALASTHYFKWCDQWLTELARVLRPGRTCVVLNIPLLAMRHFTHMETLLTFQNWITWDALAYPVRLIMPAHYALLCFSKGPPRDLPGMTKTQEATDKLAAQHLRPLAADYCLRAACVRERRLRHIDDRTVLTDLWSDIHRLKHNTRRVDHPCQLPPHLMYRLISLFTEPGEIVLDCFNGAGTTTLAAAQLHRTYVGIELSEEYHHLAATRHADLANGMDPFRKAQRELTAKNSPVPRLPKQRYVVSKKALQLEVKRIRELLGRMPDRDDVMHLSRYSIGYYEKYFLSWGEVCAAARTTGMSESRGPARLVEAAVQLDLM